MSAQVFRSRRLRHAAFAPVLILAILFAQWQGLTHLTSVIERTVEGGAKAQRPCAAFDNAILGAEAEKSYNLRG